MLFLEENRLPNCWAINDENTEVKIWTWAMFVKPTKKFGQFDELRGVIESVSRWFEKAVFLEAFPLGILVIQRWGCSDRQDFPLMGIWNRVLFFFAAHDVFYQRIIGLARVWKYAYKGPDGKVISSSSNRAQLIVRTNGNIAFEEPLGRRYLGLKHWGVFMTEFPYLENIITP